MAPLARRDQVYLTGWDEKDLGLDMNRYWTNLAASGNPNLRNHEFRERPHWPAVQSNVSNVSAVHLAASGIRDLSDVFPVQCNFFENL